MNTRGPAYPFQIDPATGQIAWATDDAKINDNVRIILATRRGERPMNREFGTVLHQLVQEPNDGGLARLIARQAREALLQLEPRIIVTDIHVRQRDGELILEMHYVHSDRPKADVLFIPLG